jgi:hypothetical protein
MIKTVRDQLIKWILYNLIIFPVLMVFYIPYQLWWIQLTVVQLWKYVLTAGVMAAGVNFILRPVNRWASNYIDLFMARHFPKKKLVVEPPDEEGIFMVSEVEDSKK